jgi:large subunit ribosomal protein L31e
VDEMAKKKIISKEVAKPEVKEIKEEKKRGKKAAVEVKAEVKEEVKVKKAITEEVPAEEIKTKKKASKKKAPSAEDSAKQATSDKIDAVSIDEVAEELEAFEEQPSALEKQVAASEKEFNEEIQEERIYVIPLARESQKAPNWNRTNKSMKVLRQFVMKHMKPEAIYVSQEVNERLWENGIKHPPRKLRVRVTKSVEGLVRVFLA